MLKGFDDDDGELLESSCRATRDEYAEVVKRMYSASGSDHAERENMLRGSQWARDG